MYESIYLLVAPVSVGQDRAQITVLKSILAGHANSFPSIGISCQFFIQLFWAVRYNKKCISKKQLTRKVVKLNASFIFV